MSSMNRVSRLCAHADAYYDTDLGWNCPQCEDDALGATRICTHCQQPQRGFASLTLSGIEFPLCHPDTGMDCYRLVTIYRHTPNRCRCTSAQPAV